MFGGRLDPSELSEAELGEDSSRRMVPVPDAGPQTHVAGTRCPVDDGMARFGCVAVPVCSTEKFVGEFWLSRRPVAVSVEAAIADHGPGVTEHDSKQPRSWSARICFLDAASDVIDGRSPVHEVPVCWDACIALRPQLMKRRCVACLLGSKNQARGLERAEDLAVRHLLRVHSASCVSDEGPPACLEGVAPGGSGGQHCQGQCLRRSAW